MIPKLKFPSKERQKEMDAEWSVKEAAAKGFLENDIPAFNKALWEVGVGAVLLKK